MFTNVKYLTNFTFLMKSLLELIKSVSILPGVLLLSCNLTPLHWGGTSLTYDSKRQEDKTEAHWFISPSLPLSRLVPGNRAKEESRKPSMPWVSAKHHFRQRITWCPIKSILGLWEDTVCFRFSILEITLLKSTFNCVWCHKLRDLFFFPPLFFWDKTSHLFFSVKEATQSESSALKYIFTQYYFWTYLKSYFQRI